MADMWGISKNTVIEWLREYDLYRFDEDPEAYRAEHCVE